MVQTYKFSARAENNKIYADSVPDETNKESHASTVIELHKTPSIWVVCAFHLFFFCGNAFIRIFMIAT